MRSLVAMDTIQIEITNACNRKCANCTRFGQHVSKPFMMSFDMFKEAIDSMIGYPKMTGIMGGEPLLHPDFEKMCAYALSKIPRAQLGLWTCLPSGYEHYREIIVKTFKHVFLNDHSRADIFHHPFLVAAEDVFPDRNQMFVAIDSCFFQHAWSASINPNGAFFCEMAASLSNLFGGEGWPVVPGWWWRTSKDFREQIEFYCPKCGGSAQLQKRSSLDPVDDISASNLERLKMTSPKLRAGKYSICYTQSTDCMLPMANYKDTYYRNLIAERYGMYLSINDQGFWEPHLGHAPKRYMDIVKERLGG